jgi:hypothetical protein
LSKVIPAAQQPQREHCTNAPEQIRTQARALSDIITLEPNTAKELTHIEGELWDIANKMEQSRPHPPAPECKYKTALEACSAAVEDAARAAALAERENIDKYISSLQAKWGELSNCLLNEIRAYIKMRGCEFLPYGSNHACLECEIKEYCESLRSTQSTTAEGDDIDGEVDY